MLCDAKWDACHQVCGHLAVLIRHGIHADRRGLLPGAATGDRVECHWDDHLWKPHNIAHEGFIHRRANEGVNAVSSEERFHLLNQQRASTVCLCATTVGVFKPKYATSVVIQVKVQA